MVNEGKNVLKVIFSLLFIYNIFIFYKRTKL